MKFEYVNIRDRERKWFKFKTQVQMFFFEFCEICENTLFFSTPLLGTSVLSMVIKVVHQIF